MNKLIFRFRDSLVAGLFFLALLLPIQSFSQTGESVPTLKDVISDSDESSADVIGVNTQQKKLVKAGPDDEFGRGVPRSSVEGYFKAVKAGDLKRAAKFLDLRNLPRGYTTNDGPELARQLKVVLDRSLWVEMDLLSVDEKGHDNDGLPRYRDLVGQIEMRSKNYDILLQHVPRGEGVRIWKFSSKTVRNIPRLYKEFGYGPIGEKLSKELPDFEFLGLQFWQWAFLLLIVLAAIVVTFPFVRIISWLVRRRKTELSLMTARFINGPVNVVLVLLIVRQYFELVHPSVTARAISEAGTLFTVVMIWALVRLVSLFSEFYTEKLHERGQAQTIVLLGPAVTTIKIIIVFLGLLVWLDNIGFSVTTVLAGLGIGGIAIALATQKSIENFIGALTLYVAAPVKVGDFCRFGDQLGNIEEIGLRATKIRTLENTVVSVPNAEFSSAQIENLTERKRFRFNPCIRLHLETTPEQVREVLLKIRALLQQHNKLLESPLRVNFAGFSEHALDVEIHCYIDTTDINEFKDVAEQLNLSMMDIIRSAGTRIAIQGIVEYSGELS